MKRQIWLVVAAICGVSLASAQPVVRVWGIADSLAIKAQVTHYLRYLDVHEQVYVLVNFTTRMPKKLDGMTYPVGSPVTQKARVIRVRINARLRKKQQDKVLAHEMVHVKQYAKGEVKVIDSERVLWRGRAYYYHRAERHANPWEREAYRIDRLVLEAGRKRLPVLVADKRDSL